MPFGREHQPGAEMPSARCFRELTENHLDIVQRIGCTVQPAACDGGAGAALAGLGIGEIDQFAGGEIRVDGDVEHAALSGGIGAGRVGQRQAQRAVFLDDADGAAVALGDQDCAVGQERHAPRMVQPVGDDRELHVVVLGLEGLRGGVLSHDHANRHNQ
jgi:hypothetical protein